MDHHAHAQAQGPPPPRLEDGAGLFIWQTDAVAGVTVTIGVFDHPPPAILLDAGITYREASDSGANHWLRLTTEQATKWAIWSSKLTGPVLP